MKYFYFSISALVITLMLYATASTARVMAPSPTGNCLSENASISLQFNDSDADIDVIKQQFDREFSGLEKIAKDAGAEEFTMQSLNYNINAQRPYGYNNQNGGRYNLSGNASFKIAPSDKAIGVMAALVKKGYQASLNVNTYNRGGCNPVVNPPIVQ
ncbi:MAG TPA: SIMPL domain-containing protein [Rickettsiales bacterium]|nr:SIMPL domain-containing protein [Rickettsiales bacterium]